MLLFQAHRHYSRQVPDSSIAERFAPKNEFNFAIRSSFSIANILICLSRVLDRVSASPIESCVVLILASRSRQILNLSRHPLAITITLHATYITATITIHNLLSKLEGYNILMANRRVICALARAFVSPSKETRGGNPVSIFLSSAFIHLAKVSAGCDPIGDEEEEECDAKVYGFRPSSREFFLFAFSFLPRGAETDL